MGNAASSPVKQPERAAAAVPGARSSAHADEDGWLEETRDDELVRLTGKHPLNAEPPLSKLTSSFITEAAKGYVRNHGAVPRLDAASHRLEVYGLGLEGTSSFSMDELRSLPSASVTVTFACSGTRRREVNAVKPSIGVPFGPASVQTATFQGVYAKDLLTHCGLHMDSTGTQRPRFVNFAGPADELPRGEYGTSLPLGHVMNPACEVMLAWSQNGETLLPDHGYPLRLVIPGYIGGRMVKWLSRVEVADHESQSTYYYHDNRLFPATVQAYDDAEKGNWWYKPEFIIGEMNISSVITHPEHGHIVELEGDEAKAGVEVKGYAYSGGGRRVVTVEVSLDDAQTWEPVTFLPDSGEPNAYGMWWSWRLWTFQAPLDRLLECPGLVVRAFDTSFNTQPEGVAWNLLGMMNNARYKLEVKSCRSERGHLALTFMHPQPPHVDIVDKAHGRPPCEVERRERPQVHPSARAGTSSKYTRAEVAQHRSEQDLWLIVSGKVYDVSSFLPDHPGGSGIITASGGDVCQEFDDIHSMAAHDMLKEYYIGDLEAADEETKEEPGQAVGAEQEAGRGRGPLLFLDPHEFKPVALVSKDVISQDTCKFRFALPDDDMVLGLPLGQHVYLRARIDGQLVLRPYTPTSLDACERGFFDLVVKVYRAHTSPRFPEGGKMSQHLDQLSVGETVDVKGPMGHVRYTGDGRFVVRDRHLTARHVGMLAGGTGITPMYQLVRASLLDGSDDTTWHLLFANNTPTDVLLRQDLDQLAAQNPQRFKVWYTVSHVPVEYGEQAWPFSIGYINKDMIRDHLPPPDADGRTCILLCGPPPMIQFACQPNLQALGYHQDQIIEF